MSINKETLHKPANGTELPFYLLPDEVLQYRTATARQSLNVRLHNPLTSIKVNISAGDGHIFVTNKRLVYVTALQGDLDSLTLEFRHIAALQFSHALKSPWFGANYWEFLFMSPTEPICDGFPKNDWFKGLITFNDGGLFEFVAVMNRVINDVVNNLEIDDELPSYAP